MKNKLRIGLYGYGVVGHGAYELLSQSKSINAEIVKICCKHPEKSRDISMDHFTFKQNELLENPDVDIIIEVINDAAAAYDIVKKALLAGKHVVTANKKMLALHLEELRTIQREQNVSLLYEGAACGSIPIIRNLEEYYDNEMLNAVSGIFNSSSNYILTQIFTRNKDYDIALKQAQDLGYAETNSELDIIGFDSLHKLIILTAHAYGLFLHPDEVVLHGIQNISQYDIQFAREKGYIIKPIATACRVNDNSITLYVLPQFVQQDDQFGAVPNEDNAVLVEAVSSLNQFFKGKGAGSYPIGSAILSDISAITYDYKYDYKKYNQNLNLNYTLDVELDIYFRYYDKKHLDAFEFVKTKAHYQSKEYSYVIGRISLENLQKNRDRLNTADIFIVLLPENFVH
jgi:homoserine dehydrogenase